MKKRFFEINTKSKKKKRLGRKKQNGNPRNLTGRVKMENIFNPNLGHA